MSNNIIYGYDQKLEGLRGFCALNVVFLHLLYFFGAFKMVWYPFVVHIQFAHVAVLMFFFISGYVIGLNHLNTECNGKNVISYLKKRAVRLYPLYLISLVICVIFNYKNVQPLQMLGQLFFLQEFFVKTINTNSALWSLSYEVAYYLLFIGIWLINNKRKNIYLYLIIFIVLYVLSGPSFNVVKSLMTGWIFWMFGLFISNLPLINNSEHKTNNKSLISYFLILLATHCLNSGDLITHILHIGFTGNKRVLFDDLVYIPVCALIIIEITKRQFTYLPWIRMIAYLIPAFNILVLLYFNHRLSMRMDWLFGVSFFILSIILIAIKNNIYAFGKLNFMGKISYAVYIFHFPIAYFLNSFLSEYLSGPLLLIIGIAAWLVLTFSLSIFCEIKLQPIIKRYIFRKPNRTPILPAI